MSRKLGFIDIGARGGFSSAFSSHLHRLDLVMVEPEASEADRLRAASEGGETYRVIGAALGHIDSSVLLYETVNPTCSSALKVNHDFIDRYPIHVHFAPGTISTVACARYDTLFGAGDLPVPHLMKIDVQGFEYQVLLGFGALLRECLAIELESHFYELYRGQKLLSDIIALLSSYDFVLRKISNNRSPDLNGDIHFDGNIVEVDATFTKDRPWVTAASEEVQADFRFACEVFGVKPYD